MKLQKLLTAFIFRGFVHVTSFAQTKQRDVAVTFDDLPATQGDYAKQKRINSE
jgi:hypothetical protein